MLLVRKRIKREFLMARNQSNDIAVTGFSSKFPGPSNFSDWWDAIKRGETLTTKLDSTKLKELGVSDSLKNDPDYVPVRGYLEDADRFDNKTLGISPRDAEIMDPQHRLMLEASWAALEDAGYAKPDDMPVTGVFASGSGSGYARTILSNGPLEPDLLEQVIHGTEPDFIASLISYKLNLTGPAIAVQTACSSSLVGIHLACQAIRNGDCEQALVVAAGVAFPQGGHLHIPGGINSAEGVCKPFDASADGVVEGSGVACVVLRRLSDLPEDSVTPHGIILGTAVNNDGSSKVGYFAPSISGQIEVIKSAVKNADIDPKSIGYLETHGTGTNIGDPIEWTASTEAYRELGAKENQISIGALKGNIGHLDASSGLASLLKTMQVLKEGTVPKIANFQGLNPFMDYEGSPLSIPNISEGTWPIQPLRRAAISAFGIGGTNAHIILEQPGLPSQRKHAPIQSPYLIPLSASSKEDLNKLKNNLFDYMSMGDYDLSDISYTLSHGRSDLNVRVVFAGSSTKDILNCIQQGNGHQDSISEEYKRNPVFLFTGQGSQHPGMALPFLKILPNFKQHIDDCLARVEPKQKEKIEKALFDTNFSVDELNQTQIAQPALFIMEYSIAKAIIELGIKPAAFAGHSLGEIVAAHFSGLYSLEDAIKFVLKRGEAMQRCPEGSMLAVNCSDLILQDIINKSELPISITAINTETSCVVAGTPKSINEFKGFLGNNIRSTVLRTNRAFHSPLIEISLPELNACLSEIQLLPATAPIALNASGKILKRKETIETQYFVDQAKKPVLFKDTLESLSKDIIHPTFIEIGTGQILTAMATSLELDAVALCPNRTDSPEEELLTSLGVLWTKGLSIDLRKLNKKGKRLHLPTYPFFGPKWIAPEAIKGLKKSSRILKDSTGKLTQEEKIAEAGDTSPKDVYATLSKLWRETLNHEELCEQSDFFKLGGDSLMITSLIRKVNQAFHIKVPPRKMLSAKTLKSQSQLISETISLAA